MGMSKKDYVAIAEIVKQAAPASGMPVMWQTGVQLRTRVHFAPLGGRHAARQPAL